MEPIGVDCTIDHHYDCRGGASKVEPIGVDCTIYHHHDCRGGASNVELIDDDCSRVGVSWTIQLICVVWW